MPAEPVGRPGTPRGWLVGLGVISVAATASAVASILAGGWALDVSAGFLVLWIGFAAVLSERDHR
jgi:hypothetical protein